MQVWCVDRVDEIEIIAGKILKKMCRLIYKLKKDK
jgi:hypothetical protein